jgi:tetratricopeptide (TPR) repeat protein
MSINSIASAIRSSVAVGFICTCAIIFSVLGLLSLTLPPKDNALKLTAINSNSMPTAVELLARGELERTSTDFQIQAAQVLLQKAPTEAASYNQLGAAYIQKARETGDFGFNAKAEIALDHSLQLAPDNYDALKLQATLLLTYHKFDEALAVTRRAQQFYPRSSEIYGAMTDALVELGDYEGAIAAVRAMLDLRPDASAYARVSYLCALHGDSARAIAAMRVAVRSANPRDLEGVAWYRVHLGKELINAGSLEEGEGELDRALHIFPDYHLALAAKAHARLVNGDIHSAIEFYQRAQERVPLPDTAIALGDLYTYLGRLDEAKQQYELVEFIERAGTDLTKTYSRELALFWANHDMKLDEALASVRRERVTRSDIYTFDVLAWCLFKQHQLSEARDAIDRALRLGTRDARIYYHAGKIYHALLDYPQAVKHLQMALQIDPYFDVLQADIARQTLDKIVSGKGVRGE